jgi:hypothetical protein
MTSSAEPEREKAGVSETLERSQETIDDAKDAAREALGDNSPTSDVDIPGTGEGLEADAEDVAPRPN